MWASLIFCSLHEIQFWRIVARPPNNFQRTLPFQLESCINHKLKHSLCFWGGLPCGISPLWLWRLQGYGMLEGPVWMGFCGVVPQCRIIRKWLMLHFSKLQRKRDSCLFDDFSKKHFEFQIVEILFSLQKWMSQEEPRMSLRHRVRQRKTEEKACIFCILWRWKTASHDRAFCKRPCQRLMRDFLKFQRNSQ